MAIHLKTDSAESHLRSQPEVNFPAFPWRERREALLGGNPGLWGARLARLQSREGMKTSEFTLGTQSKHQRSGFQTALPSHSSRTRNMGVRGSAPGRAPKEQSGGLLMKEFRFIHFPFTTSKVVQSPL